MRVLALGGTGAMGKHLAQILSEKDAEVVVTSRTARPSSDTIRYVQGDANDLSFLKQVLAENWDCIFDFMVYSTERFEKRVDLLLNATKQYIFLSSARVYAESEQPINENSSRLLNISTDKEFLATDEYALTKARQEDILMNSGRKNWTVIRPYITYSETRLQLGTLEKEEWLYRALRGKTIIFSNEINLRLTTMTYGMDVSAAMSSLTGNSKALGETFHITSKDALRWSDILAIYLNVLETHLGSRPKVLLQDMDKFLKCRPSRYQAIYDRFYDRKFNNSKINQFADSANFLNVHIGLKMCLQEFLKKPVFLDINWKLEGVKDTQTGEYTSLREIPGLVQKLKYIKGRYFPS